MQQVSAKPRPKASKYVTSSLCIRAGMIQSMILVAYYPYIRSNQKLHTNIYSVVVNTNFPATETWKKAAKSYSKYCAHYLLFVGWLKEIRTPPMDVSHLSRTVDVIHDATLRHQVDSSITVQQSADVSIKLHTSDCFILEFRVQTDACESSECMTNTHCPVHTPKMDASRTRDAQNGARETGRHSRTACSFSCSRPDRRPHVRVYTARLPS